MNSELVLKLVIKLIENCPVQTGQLKSSVQMLQVSPKEWMVLIGSYNATMRRIPSSQYASYTNYDKNKRTYHWVNDTLAEWVKENQVDIALESEDDDDE